MFYNMNLFSLVSEITWESIHNIEAISGWLGLVDGKFIDLLVDSKGKSICEEDYYRKIFDHPRIYVTLESTQVTQYLITFNLKVDWCLVNMGSLKIYLKQ